jgi:hypothetical protein
MRQEEMMMVSVCHFLKDVSETRTTGTFSIEAFLTVIDAHIHTVHTYVIPLLWYICTYITSSIYAYITYVSKHSISQSADF